MIIRRFLTWVDAAPAAQRAEAADALARAFLLSDLSQEDADIADAALTLLLDDPNPDVRMALANALADSAHAPHHIIMALADDRTDIAIMIFQRSPLFMDGELVDWVAKRVPSIQLAIAGRSRISTPVAAALVEVGDEAACRALLDNAGAEFASGSLLRLSERLGHDGRIRDQLLEMEDLPAAARQMLIRHHADALNRLVTSRNWLPARRADTVTREACEKATNMLAGRTRQEEIPRLIDHLRGSGQLTPAFLLRTLCAGNIAFFEMTMARLVEIDHKRMRAVIRSGNMSAFSAAYRRSSLPESAFDVFAAALSVTRARELEPGLGTVKQLPRRIMEEIIARCHGADRTDTLDDSIKLLRRLAADAARDSAREFAREVSRAQHGADLMQERAA